MPNVDSELVERFRTARRDGGLVVLEGFHALKHALRFHAEIVEAVTSDATALARAARELAPDLVDLLGGRVRSVEPAVLDEISGGARLEAVALARRPAFDARAVLGAGTAPVVLLDRPRHLGNVGAAIRVAAAAGADGVVVTGGADPWHPAAVRGAAGLQFALPVGRVERAVGGARPLVALHPDGEPFEPREVPPGAILAFGSERHGLDAAVLERAGSVLRLPMRGGVSSLNLATAVAATLYAVELDRRPRA